MVITDIKNTKIRVENKTAREILTLIDVRGGVFAGNYELLFCSEFLFVDRNLALSRHDDVEHFKSSNKKEIFFYNGEFHDKPQDEIDLDVSGQLDRLLEGNKAKEKLAELGYIFHQGEWLSKEEIEKQARLEAAYDLYCEWHTNKSVIYCFNIWKEESEFTGRWLRVVDKTGYRKGEL